MVQFLVLIYENDLKTIKILLLLVKFNVISYIL